MLFFATENSKQPKITYLQHVSFTFIFFPFDVSFYFFSCFLFSFSFFSLAISALRAFLFFLLHFPFFSSRSLFPTRFNLTLSPLNTQGHRYCSFCRQNPGRDQIFYLMLFHLDYFYKVLLHIRKTCSIFAPATNSKALHVLSKIFRPPRSGPALVLRHAGHASATHEKLKTAFR